MRKALALSLAVLLAAPVAVARGKDREAEEAYEAARRAYYALKADPQRRKLRHNWLNVAQKFDAVANKFPKSDRAPDALFTAAELIKDLSRISMLEEDLKTAIAHYEKLLELYPKDNLSDDGALALAKIHTERTGDTERARAVLELALRRLPKGDVYGKLEALSATLPAQPARRAEGKRIAARKTSTPAPQAKSSAVNAPVQSGTAKAQAAAVASAAPSSAPSTVPASPSESAASTRAGAVASSDTSSAGSPSASADRAKAAGRSEGNDAAVTDQPAPRSALADAFARAGRPPPGSHEATSAGPVDGSGTQKDAPAAQAATGTETVVATAEKVAAVETAAPTSSTAPEDKVTTPATSPAGSSQEPAPSKVAKVDPDEARARLKTAVRAGGEEITLAEQLGLKVRRVVIDAGHGGHDTGAIGKRGTREKDITLAISRRVGEILADRGLEVVLTRDDDTYVRLEDRTRIANEAKGDLFISIHCNAAENRKARGTETFTLNVAADRYSIRLAARENASSEKSISDLQFILADLATKANTEESDRLAQRVQSSLVSSLSRDYRGVQDLGTKHALFYVLLGAKMPAILVETAFLSHPEEEKWLRSKAFQETTARAIADGVQAFLDDREKVARADARIE